MQNWMKYAELDEDYMCMNCILIPGATSGFLSSKSFSHNIEYAEA